MRIGNCTVCWFPRYCDLLLRNARRRVEQTGFGDPPQIAFNCREYSFDYLINMSGEREEEGTKSKCRVYDVFTLCEVGKKAPVSGKVGVI